MSNVVEVIEEAYERLAHHIILKACEDYYTCKRALNKGHTAWGKISNCKKELASCIDFFESSRLDSFSSGSLSGMGPKIMKMIDEMVDDPERFPMSIYPFRREYDKKKGIDESGED